MKNLFLQHFISYSTITVSQKSKLNGNSLSLVFSFCKQTNGDNNDNYLRRTYEEQNIQLQRYFFFSKAVNIFMMNNIKDNRYYVYDRHGKVSKD